MANKKNFEFSTKGFNPEFIFGSFGLTRDSSNVIVWEFSKITENTKLAKKENIGKYTAKQIKYFHTTKEALKAIRTLSQNGLEISNDLDTYVEKLETLDFLFLKELEKYKI